MQVMLSSRCSVMEKCQVNELAINHNLQPVHQSVEGFYRMFGIVCSWEIILEMSIEFLLVCHFTSVVSKISVPINCF